MSQLFKTGVPEYEVMLHAVDTMTKEVAKAFPCNELRDSEFQFIEKIF